MSLCPRTPRLLELLLLSAIFVLGALIYSESHSGGYTQWSSWTLCSKSCGEGFRGRTRQCTAPKPGMFGKDCQEPHFMTEKCHIEEHCPIDGGLSEWSKFGKCDKTCGGGMKERIRSCTNPKPEYGGKLCEGEAIEKIDCNVQPCPINGGFSDWGQFSKCEITGDNTCGKGKHVRTRVCDKPVPQHGGKYCVGASLETAECEIPCPTTEPKTTTKINSTLAPNTTKAL